MKTIAVVFLISVFLFTPFQGEARVLTCLRVLSAKQKVSLTELFDKFRQQPPEAVREASTGKWVEVSENLFYRYQIFGRKGPVRIHFEGLGGRLEKSLDSKILASHSKKGRSLVIEFEGQGLTEVHRRIQLDQAGKEVTREIKYEDNVEALHVALEKILESENINFNEVVAISGHSFGGLTLSGLARGFEAGQSPSLLQFFASGVANFNHRFLSSFANLQLSMLGDLFSMMVPGAGSMAIDQAIKSYSDDPLFSLLKNDAVKMEGAVGLTMGAAKVDAINDPRSYPEGSRIQIFTGEKDQFVFPMLHWELGQASREAEHSTTLVLVEGAGHYLPMDLTLRQRRAVERLTNDPIEGNGYYYLKKSGRLVELTPSEALDIYKKLSWEAWQVQKDTLEAIFSSLGQSATYPREWR